MSVNKGRDFYKILGVDKRATTEQIEKAYKVLFNEMAISAKDDKHKDAVDKFEEVREAYMTLRSPDRRKAYDQKVTHTINLDQAYNIFESFFK
jgi:DnaJ-class molecular chaperone